MTYAADFRAWERAAVQDLYRSLSRVGPYQWYAFEAKSPTDQLPPGHVRLDAGFSGWRNVPRLGWSAKTRSQTANARIRKALGVPPGTHLVYKLTLPRATRPLYIGSAKGGNVAGRLKAHYHGTKYGSKQLKKYLDFLPPDVRDQIRVQVGYATGLPPATKSSSQDDLNYNQLFLLEKYLQAKTRPLIWDPKDRPFDEAQYESTSWGGDE